MTQIVSSEYWYDNKKSRGYVASVDSIEAWEKYDCVVDKFKIINNVGEFDLLILISGQLKIIESEQQTKYILTFIEEKLAKEINRANPEELICGYIRNATIAKQFENGISVHGSGSIYIFRQNRKSRNVKHFQLEFLGRNSNNTKVDLREKHNTEADYTCAFPNSGRFPQINEMKLFKSGKIRSEVFTKLDNKEIEKLKSFYNSVSINISKMSQRDALRKISGFQKAVLLLSESSSRYGLEPFIAAPIRYFDIGRNGLHDITFDSALI